MSYMASVEMASSISLLNRIIACVAQQQGQLEEPLPVTAAQWAQENIWRVVNVDTSWATDWDYATAQNNPNVNPDTGARTDVIADNRILSAVQTLLGLV